jgi:hypothetical protein
LIKIKKSPTADSRTCNTDEVSKKQLLASTELHLSDIKAGFAFFIEKMKWQADYHDQSKLTHIDDFYRNFKTKFKERDWWDYHQKVERHHFHDPKYVPEDVNLIDVLDQIIDGVMAGMARSGSYRFEPFSNDLLQRAYENTIKLLLENVTVED